MKTSPTPKVLIRAGLIAILIPVVMVAAFVFPTHDPKPDGIPIAVTGSPAQARALLGPLGDVSVDRVPDAAAARAAVRDRSADGAIVAGARPAVYIASGDSYAGAALLEQTALASGVSPTRIDDLAPLPSGDPHGTSLNLTVLGLLVGSIVGAVLLIAAGPVLPRGRREAIMLTVAIGVGAAVTGLLKAVSALPGPYLAELATIAGLVLATASIAAGLTRLLGQLGTSLSFLLFLVVANPASGLATGLDLLPTPWKQVGPWLPPGAAGQSIRGFAYFDGAANLGPILALAGWIAVGLGLNLLAYGRRTPVPSPATPSEAEIRRSADAVASPA